jgi:hypothetical protein
MIHQRKPMTVFKIESPLFSTGDERRRAVPFLFGYRDDRIRTFGIEKPVQSYSRRPKFISIATNSFVSSIECSFAIMWRRANAQAPGKRLRPI